MKDADDEGTPIEVLLVEDSPGDARLTQEAFRAAGETMRLHVVADGVDAMAFLRKEGVYNQVSAPRSHLVGFESTQNGRPAGPRPNQGR